MTREPMSASEFARQQFLDLIIQSATDFAIFSIDPDGLVTTWNVGAERVLGYSEAEIFGKSADVIFPPEEGGKAAGIEERRRALADGRAEDERWQMRKDGSRFWASGLMMPLADRDLGFVKILRDRTEQRRAEQQLRTNEERFRLLATNIPQMVFRSRPNGSRTWGSPQWISFTGLDLESSIGFGWFDAVHPEDRDSTAAAWLTAQKTGEYYVEHRVRRAADGEYRWHQTRARPVEENKAEWVGTMTDVHEMRSLQDRQQVLMAELQHRTRNLLAVVQSIARQTLRSSASLSQFGTEFESRLRALSRVQALFARADQRDIDLRDLVLAELSAHRSSAEEHGKIDIDGQSVPLPVTAAQALALALHELVTNAVKYGALSPSGGTLQVGWRIEEHGRQPHVVLDWTETGSSALKGGPPKRKGYGSELIERALPYQLGAKTKLEFREEGVHCSIVMPLEANDAGMSHGR